jgi:hypothetical protein
MWKKAAPSITPAAKPRMRVLELREGGRTKGTAAPSSAPPVTAKA